MVLFRILHIYLLWYQHQDISYNIGEVSKTLNLTNKNVAQGYEVSEKIVKEVAEADDAIKGMLKTSTEVNSNAQELAKLAEQLKDLVNKFKIS